jgi:hypothetical protein
VQFALLPFGVDALHHFVYFERPEDVALEDVEAFAPVGMAPAPMAATELQPRGQDFVTQGQLYRSLETGLRHLADKMGEDGLFIGPPWAQATRQAFGWEEMVAVHDLDTALQVLNTIVSQGEGASGETAGSHYARFRVILDELKAILADDPTFVPAHPVTAAIVRTVEGSAPSGPQITDPATAAASDLFNVVYDLILQMLSRFFAFGHETDEQSSALAHAAVGLMFGAIRPLGTLLASLPVGAEHADATAGANFQLAYKSNFLLPHRRVAWIRFSERLDEAASYAETISGSDGARRVLDAVAKSLRSTLTRLAAHIEAV